MERKALIQEALQMSWHRQTAEASLDRWLQLCEAENWGPVPEAISELIAVFGASWYFTRFIFYRGRKSAALIDQPYLTKFDGDSLRTFLSQSLQAEDQENQFEWLRSLKNQAMLQILLRRLSGQDGLPENEAALTQLAIATLNVAMRISGLQLESVDCEFAVLGMGRIAGMEMNFGSDLDLIFLYEDRNDEIRQYFSEKIRFLLRNMSMQSPTGVLYDIDMRLRPHGTAGALITSVTSFLEYHSGEREIWERQMMTRCSPVIDYHLIGEKAMSAIDGQIYRDNYDDTLAGEILQVRKRVIDELGTRRGKIDIKRGRGGIMDIDFLTHYLQLMHGRKCPLLQISSTRQVLTTLAKEGFLSADLTAQLLDNYDYFKTIESCLRLFDLKSVNTFSENPGDDSALVRAMSYQGEGAATKFLEDFNARRDLVHASYNEVLGQI